MNRVEKIKDTLDNATKDGKLELDKMNSIGSDYRFMLSKKNQIEYHITGKVIRSIIDKEETDRKGKLIDPYESFMHILSNNWQKQSIISKRRFGNVPDYLSSIIGSHVHGNVKPSHAQKLSKQIEQKPHSPSL